MTKLRFLAALGGVAVVSLVAARDARACGGCFHQEQQSPEQVSVVTSHRMALSVSPVQTVLWDQVEYSGSPGEFAWVLPVKPGARVEVASDAWFETLEAATATRINAPALACSQGGTGFGCGPMAGCAASEVDSAGGEPAEPDPVTVVHRGSAGPYETVTLHSDVPGALASWLIDNGYAIDADIQPVIDAYSGEGFDFIALRLLPEQGIQQMKPVRVVQPGIVATLPLRMVAAGTGANVGLTLFVIGEGRWEPANFPHAEPPLSEIVWDFNLGASNYTTLRDQTLAADGGRTWLTSYAKKGALLAPLANPVNGSLVQYSVGSYQSTTIAAAFAAQAFVNGETSTFGCLDLATQLAASGSVVASGCPDVNGECNPPESGELAAQVFACPAPPAGAPLDDLAQALAGLHPRDVWLTRLEANLPRAALSDDLVLGAAGDQSPVENWIVAADGINASCPLAGAAAADASGKGGGGGKRGARSLLVLVAGLFVAAAVVRRRLRPLVATRA